MSRFGFYCHTAIGVDFTAPVQACATFEDHVFERESHSQTYACLAEVVRGLRYRHMHDVPTEIAIERVRLDSQGYDARGRYYGTGAPVYELAVYAPDGEGLSDYSHGVRAPSRAWLRSVLKRLFPKAKVAR